MQTSNQNGDISPFSGQYQTSISSKRKFTNIYNIKGRVSALAIAIAQDGTANVTIVATLTISPSNMQKKDFNDKSSG